MGEKKVLQARVSTQVHIDVRSAALRLGVTTEKFIEDAVIARVASKHTAPVQLPDDPVINELSEDELLLLDRFARVLARRDEKATKWIQGVEVLLDTIDL